MNWPRSNGSTIPAGRLYTAKSQENKPLFTPRSALSLFHSDNEMGIQDIWAILASLFNQIYSHSFSRTFSINICAMVGSNCVPEHLLISFVASSSLKVFSYVLLVVIAA